MTGKIHVSITDQALDIRAAHDFVADPAHGAIDSFVGMVRAGNLGRDVVGITYDVHEALAKRIMQDLCETVQRDNGGKVNIYLSHFKGRLAVGGIGVMIAVSTPHRAEAFAACRALIEAVKHEAPIWKQEHYTDGNSEWVKGHALCAHG